MTQASRIASRAVLAVLLAGGLLAAPSMVPAARAAAPDLTISSDARYDVQPAQRRIRINLDLLLTNHLKDTVTRRYYFDRAFLAVLPNTSSFKLTWEGKGAPSVHVSKRTKDYTLLRLDLGGRLFSGKSARYKLRFDLVDPGGTPTRDVRVGDSLVSFPVWAFATDGTPGSSVKVVFPTGFSADVRGGLDTRPRGGRRGPDDLPDRQARQAALVLRVSDRRSSGRVQRTDRVTGRRRLAGHAHDPVVAGRRDVVHAGRRSRRACPPGAGRCDRPALAPNGRTDGAGGGQPIDRWLCRPVRSGQGRGRGGLLRRRRRGPARGGPRLVQRRAPGRPMGERGLRLVLRPRDRTATEAQGGRRRADPGGRGGAGSRSTTGVPSAARRARSRTTPTRPR